MCIKSNNWVRLLQRLWKYIIEKKHSITMQRKGVFKLYQWHGYVCLYVRFEVVATTHIFASFDINYFNKIKKSWVRNLTFSVESNKRYTLVVDFQYLKVAKYKTWILEFLDGTNYGKVLLYFKILNILINFIVASQGSYSLFMTLSLAD